MQNRRSFIKSAAATAIGTMLGTGSTFGFSSELSIKPIGLQLWSVAKLLQEDLSGTLQLVSKIGYREVELFGPYPFSSQKDQDSWKAVTAMLPFSQSGYFGKTAKEFKAHLDSNGLKTPCMHVGLDTLRTKLSETADAMHILGQQYAGIAAIPAEERKNLDGYKKISDDFNSIGKKAKELGIRFYYHNHGYGFAPIDGKIPFDIILERTDPSLVFLEMDTYWTAAAGADPVKYLDANPGRYKMMHVKDMSKLVRFSGDGGDPQQWIELFPYITDAGSGVLDFKTILSHAKKSGVEHFLIEHDAMTNPQESLKKGYNYLNSIELKG